MDCLFFKVRNEDEENIDYLSLTIKHDRFMPTSLRDKLKKPNFSIYEISIRIDCKYVAKIYKT